jgi:hypothetical protein
MRAASCPVWKEIGEQAVLAVADHLLHRRRARAHHQAAGDIASSSDHDSTNGYVR